MGIHKSTPRDLHHEIHMEGDLILQVIPSTRTNQRESLFECSKKFPINIGIRFMVSTILTLLILISSRQSRKNVKLKLSWNLETFHFRIVESSLDWWINWIESDFISSWQALNGFLLILTCDGEVFYTSDTVETYLGFHQVIIDTLFSITYRLSLSIHWSMKRKRRRAGEMRMATFWAWSN